VSVAENKIMKVYFIDYVTIPNSLVSFQQSIQVETNDFMVPRIGEKITGFRDDGTNQPVFNVIDVIYIMPENQVVIYLDFVKYI
jgi:hypothetical protein